MTTKHNSMLVANISNEDCDRHYQVNVSSEKEKQLADMDVLVTPKVGLGNNCSLITVKDNPRVRNINK